MTWIILKFGGSSVSKYENWKIIIERIQYFTEIDYNVMVVISALSGITNLLQDICSTSNIEKRTLILNQIHEKHKNFITESGIYDLVHYNKQLKLLTDLIQVPILSIPQQAEIMGYGELFSTTLGNQILNNKINVRLIDSRDYLISKYDENKSEYSNFLNCNFDFKNSEVYLSDGVYLTQGFIASIDTNGVCYPCILGRGGSDTSGSIYAYCLNALKYEIWTDVNGIYSIDPRVSKNWKILKYVDYKHAYNIAFTGGKVLHEKCVIPLEAKNIECVIKNTMYPNSQENTIISNKYESINVISGKTGITFIEFQKEIDVNNFVSQQYNHYIYDRDNKCVVVENLDVSSIEYLQSCNAKWWSKCFIIGMSDYEQHKRITLLHRLNFTVIYSNNIYQIVQSEESLNDILSKIDNFLDYSNKAKIISIVGCSGAVGLEIIKTLHHREFPVKKLILFGNKSVGMNLNTPFGVLPIQQFDLDNCRESDICFLASTTDFSKEYAKQISYGNTIVIDNSNAFRYDDDVPLCVPEINPCTVFGKKLIANPNCTTAISSVVLFPIHKKFQISSMILSTYQASSGAGNEGIEELNSGLKQYALTGNVGVACVFPHQLPLNVIPHIDMFMSNGYTKEELKFLWETRKIFGDNTIEVSCTSVRVPTLRSHCASISIKTIQEINAIEVRELLKKSPGVEVVDDPEQKQYPMPIISSEKYNTLVGRIRQSLVFKNHGIDLFLSGDQLLKGAALNAVQIAELLV